jgi:hypothetical protein
VLDLGPRSRVAFAALWVGMQVVLITTATRRVDGVFGFLGVAQSNVVRVHLEREVDEGGVRVVRPVPRGEWVAKDARGEPRRFAWSDRVRDPVLRRTDEPVPTTVSAEAIIRRTRAALDDVAAHDGLSDPDQTPGGDRDTRALIVTLTLTVNGREQQEVTMRSGRP